MRWGMSNRLLQAFIFAIGVMLMICTLCGVLIAAVVFLHYWSFAVLGALALALFTWIGYERSAP